MQPIQVLCVEDNQLVAEAIGRKLAHDSEFAWLGWVDSLEGLVERAKQPGPAVICMDLNMPGQDPFEMIQVLREQRPEWRVLVFTGYSEPENIERALDAGAWGFLSKAEEPRLIVDAIRRVASGSFVLGELSQAAYERPRPAVRSGPDADDAAATSNRSAIRDWISRGLKRIAR
jgi:DNA-binding NarL/FixJ family response regulator